jgi:hypothetical protein
MQYGMPTHKDLKSEDKCGNSVKQRVSGPMSIWSFCFVFIRRTSPQNVAAYFRITLYTQYIQHTLDL